jgi:hypothetical protein
MESQDILSELRTIGVVCWTGHQSIVWLFRLVAHVVELLDVLLLCSLLLWGERSVYLLRSNWGIRFFDPILLEGT